MGNKNQQIVLRMKASIKIFIILSLNFIFPFFCLAYNPDLDDEEYKSLDTIITHNKYSFKFKSISKEDFEKLKAKHYIKPSQAIMDIKKVQKMLNKDFYIKYWSSTIDKNSKDSNYILTEFRNGEKFRYLIDESEGFGGYYPKERIICYYGGHYSGNAFFIDSGDDAYDPSCSAISKDKKYLLHGLESGQEGNIYKIQKYDNISNNYIEICELYEIREKVNYDMGFIWLMAYPFWIDNTLYFRTGFYGEPYYATDYNDHKFFSITIIE